MKKRFFTGVLNGLFFWFLIIGIINFWPLVKLEFNYRFSQKPVADVSSLPEINIPDPYFSLVIPKIKAEAKIMANIDAGNPEEYQAALRKGVAHAKGTVFPGMKGTIFLFAHSTNGPWNVSRYNAVFYLLDKLAAEDKIVIFFNSKIYIYRVTERKIVSPTETGFFSQKEEELLVLQTCYPPGTIQKALLIFAKRI